ncbi:MAG: peptidoglycan DD-metalloendopeptidase family protein [Oscillospiraceae bacterium]|nr:peptidoglycan DD-metalloendopeptidase family protein [Oscillospiraceae bacterium]
MREILCILGITALCGWLTALPLLFARKIPARLKLKLAALPLVTLLCPLPLFCRRTVVLPAAETVLLPAVPTVPELPAVPAPVSPAESPVFTVGAELIGVIWLIGMFFYLLMQLSHLVSLKRHLAERSEVTPGIRAVYDTLCSNEKLRRRPELFFFPGADTPLLTGIFRPMILLPRTEYTSEELQLILRHELTHHKQGHLLLQAMARLAAAVHWFHPLGHLLLRALPRICEEACDETLASKLTPDERKHYGLVILRFAGKEIGGCAALAARHDMERRLKAVMNPKHISPRIRLWAILSAALLLLGSCGISYALAPEQVKQAEISASDLSGILPGPETSSGSAAEESSLPEEDPAAPSEPASEPSEEPVPPESEITPEPDENVSEPVSEVPAEILPDPQPEQEGEYQEVTHYPAQCWPLPGHTTITAEFGGSHDHHGIDISGENIAGAPIAAWRTGTVLSAGYDTQHGNCILIDHGDGLCSFYAHCESLAVKEGENVAVGQTIAAAGATGMATGPHLHFELQLNGTPIDPVYYLPLNELCGYPKAKYFQGESHHEESSGHHEDHH